MTDPATQATIRAVFRSIPQELVLRESPKAKIDERAFREILKPLEEYMMQNPKKT